MSEQPNGATAPVKDEELDFRVYLTQKNRDEFVRALGSKDKADLFIRVVLTATQQNPDLLTANRRSLMISCMRAAQDGLLCDGREAVLNIYSTKTKKGGADVWVPTVQYLPMVGGLIKKLYEAGCTYVDAAAVYANDEFAFERGDAPRLVHKPTMTQEPGELIAAYLVVKLPNGEIKREVMPRRDIEAVRHKSKAPDALMWKDFYDQGAIKSVIKRGYKQLPHTEALDRLIEHDNEAMGFDFTKGDSTTPALEHQPVSDFMPTMKVQPDGEKVAAAGQNEAQANATATQQGNGATEQSEAHEAELMASDAQRNAVLTIAGKKGDSKESMQRFHEDFVEHFGFELRHLPANKVADAIVWTNSRS